VAKSGATVDRRLTRNPLKSPLAHLYALPLDRQRARPQLVECPIIETGSAPTRTFIVDASRSYGRHRAQSRRRACLKVSSLLHRRTSARAAAGKSASSRRRDTLLRLTYLLVSGTDLSRLFVTASSSGHGASRMRSAPARCSVSWSLVWSRSRIARMIGRERRASRRCLRDGACIVAMGGDDRRWPTPGTRPHAPGSATRALEYFA